MSPAAVQCTRCDWQGREAELVPQQVPMMAGEAGMTVDTCPHCGWDTYLYLPAALAPAAEADPA